jgi:2-amino-4-hydroxy-6-hydroxymethyldihydropteridine diphosphokinase
LIYLTKIMKPDENYTWVLREVDYLCVLVTMDSHILFLLLGSNLGDRAKYIGLGLTLITQEIGTITDRSSFYETEPWGFDQGENFLNMAVRVETHHDPEAVMENILQIERQCGRERSGDGYASRTLDIDVLFYDDRVMAGERITVPHPRLQDRRFVLVPLAEIAPGLIHPVTGKSIKELLETCSDPKMVRRTGQSANTTG